MKFVCELMTDVILNVKSASEGNNQTLDFIPGNVFLGIVAKELYSTQSSEENAVMFHSGKVRFGDAHPACGNARTWRIPSEFFMDKEKKEDGPLYIHLYLSSQDHKNLREENIQLKQYRSGFYWAEDNVLIKNKTQKSFAIKSANDTKNRTSLKDAMYGYESLQKGARFYFSVEAKEKDIEDKISKVLIGEHFIGRSKTAQYGMVQISEFSYNEVESSSINDGLTTVYADGRLIFLNTPLWSSSFNPQVLGIKGGKIRWDLTQIRTFQYAPWNSTRQAFDPDRYGIEKGSVFVVEGAEGLLSESSFIGNYQNEGFGKVIYNPSFLECDEKGCPKLHFTKESDKKSEPRTLIADNYSGLLSYLVQENNNKVINGELYELVNDFVEIQDKKELFKGNRFASQWGHIRNLAMQFHDDKQLYDALFADSTGYLTHGTAEEKWSERRRLVMLKNECEKATQKSIPLYLFLINLASQMQKYYRNKK